MANVRGVNGTNDRNLVGTAIKMTGSRGAYYMIDAQLDTRDPKVIAVKDTNPHLESHEFKLENGETRVAHGKPYTEQQFEKMREAGVFKEVGKDMYDFALKANLMIKKDKEGNSTVLIRTDKPMGKSDFGLDNKTLKEQKKTVEKFRAERDAQRATPDKGKEEPAKEKEQPEMG